ncbi:ERCC4 domain-containing protein [Ustulina deusta]|nr:ERCC4 domain-containing protein [Ustulina deusta]
MPIEVISLLSSSPSRATGAASVETANRPDSCAPRSALDHNEQNLTTAESSKNAAGSSFHAPIEPLAGTKRASNCQTRPDGGGGDDFLFLSDDFDTTGDLDGSFYNKKPRTSRRLSHPGKRDNGLSPPRKTKSSVTGSSHRGPPQPVSIDKWSNLVEEIEFSSSPVNLTSKATGKAPEISSDPFASPPREHIPKSTSHRPTSAGLPKSPSKNGGPANWNRPAELRTGQLMNNHHETRPSSKPTFIDLSSDPINSPPRHKPQPNPSNARLRATWDPISSSAPETHDIQNSLPSPSFPTRGRPYPGPGAVAEGGSSDSDGLPDLDNIDFSKIRATNHRHHRPLSRSTAQTSKQAMKKGSRSTEEKDRERKQKVETREAEKERKRIEKERTREERVLQKEREKALAEVNKLRTDKKASTPEMIVDIPASINTGLKVQIEALLSDLNVEYETWESTVEHVVKWRRKVTSRFNKEIGLWEPTPMRIQDEGHVLVIVQAAEFVKFVLGEEGQDLEAHVLQMQSKFPSTKLIYLIEGLTSWMRKNRNLLNRQFAFAVRNLVTSAEPGPSSSQPRHRNNNQFQEYIDEDKIEDALLSLQVLHGTLVHHTNASVETAQWVSVFTQHISTIPYRKARDASADAGFCMESGQVRTGDGAKDTYIHMLQEIARVTPPIAYGIVTKYQSVADLVRGLEEEGPLALAECRKSANKDGALTDRTIGQAISKRVHKIFLGRDPTSTDV